MAYSWLTALAKSEESTHVYRGPSSPLTSLAVSKEGAEIYAGCWDKTIWSWHTKTCTPGRRFYGHTDFVKALLLFSAEGTEILVSGGADTSIIIWKCASGEKLHVLKGHARGILALTLDVAASTDDFSIFSASSDPHIRRWRLTKDLAFAEEVQSENPISQHETSVNALRSDEDGDLWTASSDGTAKCLSRERGWQADTVLHHHDYVRDVAIDEIGGLIVSVGRDEEVKIWQRSSGELWHSYSGHYEEITGCTILNYQRLITISIDCTIRRWSLRADDLEKAREEALGQENGENNGTELSAEPNNVLTEEEERELAELMEND